MSTLRPTFALTGAAGYVAPRHLEAIKDIGGRLVAALDPSDSVGILDKYDRETHFFTEPERFERYLHANPVDWLSVCSPNHLHDVHARMGMQAGANVICEKPLVLTPWNLDALEETERKTGKRVYTVLQLRHLPKLQSLWFSSRSSQNSTFTVNGALTHRRQVQLKYVTPRGAWYHTSWKGQIERSGGIITNIGIHMLDMLMWLYGGVDGATVTARSSTRAMGSLTLACADVQWLLSIDETDTPDKKAFRSLIVDGEACEFSDGFTGLHTKVYEETLAGNGHGISVTRPAVELAYRLRNLPIT